ncbi:two-component system sensor histidine kinase AdeS [Mesorhizobium soli]|uniref:ATP-binding protein n=1 Tax=Pseudaminobacter soli (ex Li et al. 2025) TaxID=1295366 RepID=UPI0024749F2E|nr:ATP-binding protein [Mesorhizobium soli]MDH6233916.1 two-component system sensor histidine kinase AdeS [Mesorhizobium soli]
MKIPSLSLARLTAIVIAAMLLLSVGLAYLGVSWYSSYLEESIIDSLSPNAAAAYKDMNAGIVPDAASLRELFDHINTLTEPANFQLYMSVLVCGLLSALMCSLIGFYLARRIARPLEELTSAADSLKSGDFSVRVSASHKGAREISSLVETFNALAMSLETMEERLRFNNMAVAHELRTPLTILRGSMQGMLDGVFPMEQKTVSNLLLQVEGLTRLVEDLRTLSLAIGHKLVVDRDRLNAAELVEAVLASAKPMLDASELTVETQLRPAYASVDSQRVRQALLALLENACRYAAIGGVLRCETETLPDKSVAIRVMDRGPGFPEDMDAIAVNPFWRGDPSRSRATGGTGLGLSVVQAIATAHGGHLTFSNRSDGGATVAIVLPKHAEGRTDC